MGSTEAKLQSPGGIPGFIQKIDRVQQRHGFLAFPFAVIKKFGEDNGGYQAALITYYGFLSMFPLLLVLITVVQLLFQGDSHFQREVMSSVSNFFPVLGAQLQKNIHASGKTGIGLAIALLFSLYGARGGADALRFTQDNMWRVPHLKRLGFPKNILRSLGIIGYATLGFAATIAVSSITSGLGHALWIKILLNLVGVGILATGLALVFHLAVSQLKSVRVMLPGALFAATIIQLLLTFGSILIKHQLKSMDSIYGTFAVVLGLLFWIYLLAQAIVYGAEINTVRHKHLWPRSLSGALPTAADHKIQAKLHHDAKDI